LDYGAGTGVVSAALTNVDCFEVSAFARDSLRNTGRRVIERVEDIPLNAYDGILCSHSLEHHVDPHATLSVFRRAIRPHGHLVIVLPVETDYTVYMTPDCNQHYYCWTFQTLTNLLTHCKFRPVFGQIIYGPFLLRTLGRRLSTDLAVSIAHKLGRVKRSFKSMLMVSRPDESVGLEKT
jgi:hypothetical protein